MRAAPAIARIASAYGKTLDAVATTLSKCFGGDSALWGVAGFREEDLMFLLAETMRGDGWELPKHSYEISYPGCRQRGDLQATKDDVHLWFEARWWWHGDTMLPIVNDLVPKLKKVSGEVTPVLLVFTMENLVEAKWDEAAAHQSMVDSSAGHAALRAVATSAVRSPYFGAATASKTPAARTGLLAATFYIVKQ